MHQHHPGAGTQGQPVRGLIGSLLLQLDTKLHPVSDDDAIASLEGLEVRESAWAEWQDTYGAAHQLEDSFAVLDHIDKQYNAGSIPSLSPCGDIADGRVLHGATYRLQR